MEHGRLGEIGTRAQWLVVAGHRGEKEHAQTLHLNMEALIVPEVPIPANLVTPILVQVGDFQNKMILSDVYEKYLWEGCFHNACQP